MAKLGAIGEITEALCDECGDTFSFEIRRGVTARSICDDCQPARARKRIKAFKDRNREKVRAENREYMNRRYREDPEFRDRAIQKTRAKYAADPDYFKEKQREYYAQDPQRFIVRANRYARMRRLEDYGLTEDALDAMYETQGGGCAICGKAAPLRGGSKAKALHIDHDHDTGAVRGLLCSGCNMALGLFGDAPELLLAALEYLARAEL